MLPDLEGRAPWFQARDCLSILNESTLSDDSVSPDRPEEAVWTNWGLLEYLLSSVLQLDVSQSLRVRETPCPMPVAAVSVREDIDFRANKNAG